MGHPGKKARRRAAARKAQQQQLELQDSEQGLKKWFEQEPNGSKQDLKEPEQPFPETTGKKGYQISRIEARDALMDVIRGHFAGTGCLSELSIACWRLNLICVHAIGCEEARWAMDLVETVPLQKGDDFHGMVRMPAWERRFLIARQATMLPWYLQRPVVMRGGAFFTVDGHVLEVCVLESVIRPFERGLNAPLRLDLPSGREIRALLG
ncbi:uncharacterized protein BP01DRAFT_365115 [Aspergillus saccharolyticus JOP 1030-1]|uniref:Uncharacterized protein n=1 Tax=Aspergillus saccharolyticus JOP 1030-1 TaxID=1450539 RepID=A0A318ZFP2_9EURO|nr:hypothetical protein BP01DRAFT_365115 [Aspergillus saccharolyticus JOP 1030-1]PYH46371.1 hypothetical protein BP01DRAFT_365115 [Aspergillus saccharolyticus JOP 1030-1]